jgi:hypothetical protein
MYISPARREIKRLYLSIHFPLQKLKLKFLKAKQVYLEQTQITNNDLNIKIAFKKLNKIKRKIKICFRNGLDSFDDCLRLQKSQLKLLQQFRFKILQRRKRWCNNYREI